MKLPVRPSAINFKQDLDKLKQAAEGMREMINKIEFEKYGLISNLGGGNIADSAEKPNSTTREANAEELRDTAIVTV